MRPAATIRTLLIDNYDSYTYNLYQLIADVNGCAPLVATNDGGAGLEEVRKLVADGTVHNIVVSPGPGTPENDQDVGMVLDVLRALPAVPILGVCLGHQALAHVHGCSVVRAPEPVHGRLSGITHSGHPLFHGIPSGHSEGFIVVRYHSLHVPEASLSADLEPVCWTDGSDIALELSHDRVHKRPAASAERLLMGIAHRSRPHYGVQFHPESIATTYGAQLLYNFACLTASLLAVPLPPPPLNPRGPPGAQHCRAASPATRPQPGLPPFETAAPGRPAARPQLALVYQACSLGPNTSCCDVMQALGWGGTPNTFWLDSSDRERSRFSYLGGPGGPLWQRSTYELPAPAAGGGRAVVGTLTTVQADGSVQVTETGLRDWLVGVLADSGVPDDQGDAECLPFEFWGGLVGYVGYEVKAECGGRLRHQSRYADAAFFFADRLVAIDHATMTAHALSLHDPATPGARAAAADWVQTAVDSIRAGALPQQNAATAPPAACGSNARAADPPCKGGCGRRAENAAAHSDSRSGSSACCGNGAAQSSGVEGTQGQAASQQTVEGAGAQRGSSGVGGFALDRGHAQYLRDVGVCLEALHSGDSYEVCLTNALRARRDHSPGYAWRLYNKLRAVNAAPYAAWLHLGEGQPTICCSSPERFLNLNRHGVLEARPIKGTAARVLHDAAADAAVAASLAASEKDRAENLMIVDLLRNDLGRVCEPGSVHVPRMMEVESFATVHQLVSTIRGRKAPHVSAVDCFMAAFPGGSMTGAPKIRSMDILDAIEGTARGVYSGSIGFFSVNGSFDFNIVIRTAVFDGDEVSIGAGGAVVLQSDPEAEFQEMRLKASRLLYAFEQCDGEAAGRS